MGRATSETVGDLLVTCAAIAAGSARFRYGLDAGRAIIDGGLDFTIADGFANADVHRLVDLFDEA